MIKKIINIFELKKELDKAHKKIENLEKRASYADEQEHRRDYYKSEGTTLVLSLVLGLIGIQGVGHLYIGKIRKGTAILIGCLILAGAGVATVTIVIGYALLIIYFAIFIWQILDSRKLCMYYNGFFKTAGKSPW